MDNFLQILLNMLSSQQNTNSSQISKTVAASYPQEAFSNQNSDQNMMPMLLSLLKNNNSISQIFSNKKEKSDLKSTSLPDDEILL